MPEGHVLLSKFKSFFFSAGSWNVLLDLLILNSIYLNFFPSANWKLPVNSHILITLSPIAVPIR